MSMTCLSLLETAMVFLFSILITREWSVLFMLQAWDNEAGEYNTTVVITNQDSIDKDTQAQTSHSSLQLPRVIHSATVSTDWEESLSLSLTASSAAQLQRAVYSGNHRLATRNRTRGSVTSARQSKSSMFRKIPWKYPLSTWTINRTAKRRGG